MSLVAALVLVGIAMLFLESVPPHSMTHMSMSMCKRRILRYAQKHGALPSSLSGTKAIEGRHSSIKDSWGLALDYSVNANGVVTLRSLGKDNAPGGAGDNMDMIGVFSARKPDGSWSDEFIEWTCDPFDAWRQHMDDLKSRLN